MNQLKTNNNQNQNSLNQIDPNFVSLRQFETEYNQTKGQDLRQYYSKSFNELLVEDFFTNTVVCNNFKQLKQFINKLNLQELFHHIQLFYQLCQTLHQKKETSSQKNEDPMVSKLTIEIQELKNQLDSKQHEIKDSRKVIEQQKNNQNLLNNQLAEEQSNLKLLSQKFDSIKNEYQNQTLLSQSLQQENLKTQKELNDSYLTIKQQASLVKQNEQTINSFMNEQEIIKKNNEELMQKIKDLEESLNQKEIQLSSKQQNLEIVLKENEHFKCYKDKLNKYNPKIDRSKYGYDMIIQMKSIKDLKESDQQQENQIEGSDKKIKQGGIKIEQFNNNNNKKGNETFKNVIIIGTQGQKNKGKSFLLNSLIDENFPSDYHLSTPGICLKHHTINRTNVIYIDSEGLNSPITIDYENNENYQKYMESKDNNQLIDTQIEKNLQKDITERHQDLKATEQIQQEFIIESSDILMIVVSYLTLEDQKLIHQLQQKFVECKQQNKDKKIIVVHNIKEFGHPQQCQDYMKLIKKSFSVSERSINLYNKIDEDENNIIFIDNIKDHTHHVVMGHSQSEAGRVYNRFALYYIKHLIGLYPGLSNFNVSNKLKSYLNKNLQNYITLHKQNGQETDEATQDPTKTELVYFNQEKQAIMLKEGISIDKVKDLQVNIFGSIQKDCQYSIVDSKKNNERYLIMEIPGGVPPKKMYHKESGYFQISTQINKNIEQNLGETCFSTRKFDEQHFLIKINNGQELLTIHKDRTENLENGIYKFVFTKDPQDTYD